jgi:ABC-type phosphate/phosphonate transport system substrate-binding protein
MIVLAIAIAVGGCGGSSGSESPVDAKARAAYVADLNEICAEWAHDVTKTSQHFEAVEVQAPASERPRVTAERYDQLADGLDRLVGQARRLVPLDADADTVESWLASTEDRADAEHNLAAALRARPADAAAVTAAQDSLRVSGSDASAAIATLGARECAPRTELVQSGGGG